MPKKFDSGPMGRFTTQYDNDADAAVATIANKGYEPVTSEAKKEKYDYHSEDRVIDGETVSKVISSKGKIIGRPSLPKKLKKKPISLTLTPDLYDKVISEAANQRRSVSELLAIIVEDYFNDN